MTTRILRATASESNSDVRRPASAGVPPVRRGTDRDRCGSEEEGTRGTRSRTRVRPRGELEDWGFSPYAPYLTKRVAHLAHRDVRARGLDDRPHEVAVFPGRIRLQVRESRLDGGRIAPRPQGLYTVDLPPLERRIDLEDLDRLLVLERVAVHADDDPLLRLDLRLVAERCIRDLTLEEVLLDRLDDAAELADPVEVVVCLGLEPVRQLFDVVRTPERVDRVDNAGLVSDHLLCAQREPHRVLGRQRKCLVERVCVKRLGAAEHRGERLKRGPDYVDLGLLRSQRHAGRLRVETHEPRTRISRAV